MSTKSDRLREQTLAAGQRALAGEKEREYLDEPDFPELDLQPEEHPQDELDEVHAALVRKERLGEGPSPLDLVLAITTSARAIVSALKDLPR